AHYVRSGDFILNMIRESQELNEYAFALGALSHFAADNNGHRMATNVSLPLLFPKLRLKFGDSITYADDPFSHTKTEFGFDVFQAAKSRYASDAYKSFIGFEVAKPVLQRAFQDTYGMKIEHVFLNLDLALGSYQRAVGTILPALTKVAWQIKSQEIRKDAPGITRKKFLYNLSRSSYEKNWGATYERPTFRSKMLAGFFRSDILAFYQDLSLPIATKTNASDWARLQEELDYLQAVNRDLSPAGAKVSTAAREPAAK